ncbi:Arf-GAP with GTPase, ANK repeat and PH domain-containing protein 2 [Hondaea fermentalgiana]|uniref:Arf-GAP with GTPase, ANK repeat and PH domain-containing protein 2 n=1 Tax=Hondaea fermentalgiana TaxID=2315210 RepID=A0A2R5GA19_9STRA|nr:Arf-GAP with GTPase, ANK repeat and PH domain-containing protein 2 [Hondaea fermentalgiana]|eukprot:GBG27149.1 Arf-GAP with GTPase, ANK repeat and PH domain-containing protein 2 [Hondaea fermentalgiana]
MGAGASGPSASGKTKSRSNCNAPSSTWASTTFGVFLCASCAGAHRSLGAHISFMQSITLDLDNWKPLWTERLEQGGNLRVNERLEFYVPQIWPKPSAKDTPGSYVREYVKAKYDDQLFSRENNSSKTHRLPPIPWEQRTTRLARAHTSMGQGRIEYVGIVSVRVLSAEHLTPMSAAIPLAPAPSAFFTNPYCVVRLGDHEARTRAISRALNPEWNEGPQENVRFNMSWNGSIYEHDVSSLLPRDSSTEAALRASSDSLRGPFDADTSSENGDTSGDEIDIVESTSAVALSEAGSGSASGAKATKEKSGIELESHGSDTPDSTLNTKVKHHRRKRSLTKLHLREKMKDAVDNLVNVLARNGSVDSEYYMEEENDELGRARRERGYFFVGKLNLELSFLDLR